MNIKNSEGLNISIESHDSSISDQALRVKAIIALLSSLDKKSFVEDDPINGEIAFDNALEQILDEVHSVAEWGGWQQNHDNNNY